MSLLLLLRPLGPAGAPQPPSIISFVPISGPIGTVVVVTGSNFTGATDVTFNGVSAITFTVDADSQITVTVPVGATTGKIAVTTAIGTGTSTDDFTITAAIAPSAGGGVRKRREIRVRFADIENRKSTAEFLKEQLRKHQVEIPDYKPQLKAEVEKRLDQDLIEVQALDGEAKKAKIISINNAILTLLLISYDP